MLENKSSLDDKFLCFNKKQQRQKFLRGDNCKALQFEGVFYKIKPWPGWLVGFN